MSESGESHCPTCGAVLPSAFPGASVTCACGHRVDLPSAPPHASHGTFGTSPWAPRPSGPPRSGPPGAPASRAAQGDGPYRSSAPGTHLEPSGNCPFCGNEVPAMVRLCPHCDVRLENVRCQRCFSLQAPGTFACMRCENALDLEPLLDATDAPCPRCKHPLEVSPGEDSRVHECPRCGGIFVARDALAEIMCSAELGGALRDGASDLVRGAWSAEGVRYVPCPLCHATMNRVNFGRVSGVIVDVCKMHGTWFDAGELTRVVAFAASGGLDKTRARVREEHRDQKERLAADKAAVHMPIDFHGRPVHVETRLELWRDLLHALFS